MEPPEIRRFIMHYERLTRHMLQEMPDRADLVLHLGDTHRCTRIECRPKPG
jgi:D-glycerate 3-kinase